ncbi:MAG: hypothetical protein RIT28_2931 [Pseudomonadota bacterium]
MSDGIEEDLVLGLTRGDKRLQARFFDNISREWRPRIRRLLLHPSEEEVNDLLHDALMALCLPTSERPRPRVLAPADAKNPKAWRGKVLTNFIRDRLRHRGLRAHVEAYAGRELDKEVAQSAWRRRKERGEADPLPEPDGPRSVHVEEGLLHLDELRRRRDLVIELAAQQVIRRRMILLLAINADPSAFAEALSVELVEDVVFTLERIVLAMASPVEDPPSLPRVRVPWPVEPEAKARESARKALERAITTLRAALAARAVGAG